MSPSPPRTPDEERLHRRFSDLKRVDARQPPDFARMWSRSPRARAWPRILATAGTLAAAAAIALWWNVGSRGSPATPRLAARPPAAVPPSAAALGGELSARVALDPTPLDFLLDIQPAAPRGVTRMGANSNPIRGW
jgi:hypothetical protein